MDDLDQNIIDLLREDGRQSNQEVARKLNVTAVTVRSRIKRLEQANIMRVVAVTDFAAADFDVLMAVGVEVQNRKAEAVARDLAAFEQVFSVNLVTGLEDIEMIVVAKDFEGLREFLANEVASVEGIRKLSPALALDVLKYQFDSAPLKQESA